MHANIISKVTRTHSYLKILRHNIPTLTLCLTRYGIDLRMPYSAIVFGVIVNEIKVAEHDDDLFGTNPNNVF